MTEIAFFALGALPILLVWLWANERHIARLQAIVESMAARVVAQSELLSRKAERKDHEKV